MQQINCWLKQSPDDKGYQVEIEWQHHDRIRDCGIANINKQDTLVLRNETFNLQTVLGWLDNFDSKQLESRMGEDGIYALGHYLYQQTLARHPKHREFPNEQLRLSIISECPHIHRIPWTMLSRDGFLLQNTWQIALTTATPTRKVSWPSLPAILIIAPEPTLDNEGKPLLDSKGKPLPPTQAQQHINQIRKNFEHWSAYQYEDKFRVVSYWDDVQCALQNDRYDVIYYYGHGSGGEYRSRLLFESPHQHRATEMTLQDLRNELQHARYQPPHLCYINACFGSSGGLMGAGLQLSHVCDAVLSNRTAAVAATARQQGEEFLKSLIMEDRPPDIALRDALTRCNSTSGDIRMITPLLHRNYRDWKPIKKKTTFHFERTDPHWEQNLDRLTQSGTLQRQIGQAIRNNHPETLLFIWYGCEQVGVELFHKRVPIDIRELRLNIQIARIRMDWPSLSHTHSERNFEPALLAGLREAATTIALPPTGLHSMPGFLNQLAGFNSQKTLLHLQLQTVNEQVGIEPDDVALFLNWWQSQVAPHLRDARIQTVMTLGFELSEPNIMEDAFEDCIEPLNDEYSNLSAHLLPRLERLTERDIRDFLKRFFPDWSRRRMRDEIKLIIREAKGNYPATLNMLNNINNRPAPPDEANLPRRKTSLWNRNK